MLNAQFRTRVLAIVFCVVTSACAPAVIHQDPGVRDHGPPRDDEYKESYREGPCKIEREQKRDGSYKEERECKGVGPGPYRHSRGDYEEKYQDGPCKIEREWKRDGTYKERSTASPAGGRAISARLSSDRYLKRYRTPIMGYPLDSVEGSSGILIGDAGTFIA